MAVQILNSAAGKQSLSRRPNRETQVGSDGGFTVKRSMASEQSRANRVQSILNLGGNTDMMFALNWL
jgi:hypothetical protein